MSKVEFFKVDTTKCEHEDEGHTCEDLFDCCDCGGNDCGCPYCWSCNACDVCKGE